MALQSTWPLIDNVPAAHGETFQMSAVAADIDLTSRSGKPVAPTSAVILNSVTAGNFVLTLAGGGNVSIGMPANEVLFVRLAAVAIVDSGSVSDGSITVLWDPNSKKNP